MSDRYKYAKNGIYKCENFAQHVEQNRFPEIHIGSIGGKPGWQFKCTLITEDGQTFLYPSIFCAQKPNVQLRTFFNALKKDGSSGSMRRETRRIANLNTWLAIGKPFEVSELLNPENEYLDDEGSLSIEYGIHVDAILGYEKIWEFNFNDTPFNYTGEKNQMIECTHRVRHNSEMDPEILKFYCSTEILNFHCPRFVEQAKECVSSRNYDFTFFNCMQILHGVRPQYISDNGYCSILEVARNFNLTNVHLYCDQPHLKLNSYYTISTYNAMKFNLRHHLAADMKNQSMTQVRECVRWLDFMEVSGEVMKVFVAKILYN